MNGTLYLYGVWSDDVIDFMYCGLIIAFLVNIPMFLVVLWFPSAHVEAPISGSIILAGILLNLGGCGLILIFPIIISYCLNFNFISISISLMGGFLVSFVCFNIFNCLFFCCSYSIGIMSFNDFNFSSFMWLLLNNNWSWIMLFSFSLSNIVYERLGCRSLLINSGVWLFNVILFGFGFFIFT